MRHSALIDGAPAPAPCASVRHSACSALGSAIQHVQRRVRHDPVGEMPYEPESPVVRHAEFLLLLLGGAQSYQRARLLGGDQKRGLALSDRLFPLPGSWVFMLVQVGGRALQCQVATMPASAPLMRSVPKSDFLPIDLYPLDLRLQLFGQRRDNGACRSQPSTSGYCTAFFWRARLNASARDRRKVPG